MQTGADIVVAMIPPNVNDLSDLIITVEVVYLDEYYSKRASRGENSTTVPCELSDDNYIITAKYPFDNSEYIKYYEITGDNPIMIIYYVPMGLIERRLMYTCAVPTDVIRKVIDSSNGTKTIDVRGELIGVSTRDRYSVIFTIFLEKLRNKWYITDVIATMSKELGGILFQAFRKIIRQGHILRSGNI